MNIAAAGKVVLSPKMILLVIIIVIAGYAVVYFVANRKWGYTPKREKELEEADKLTLPKRRIKR